MFFTPTVVLSIQDPHVILLACCVLHICVTVLSQLLRVEPNESERIVTARHEVTNYDNISCIRTSDKDQSINCKLRLWIVDLHLSHCSLLHSRRDILLQMFVLQSLNCVPLLSTDSRIPL